MDKVYKSRQNLSVLYAAIAFAAILRLYKLGGQSVWGDEALTLLFYAWGNSIGEIWHKIWTSGGHPPLYFLTVFHWLKLGHSEFMLRFPSLVYGVAAIPVMYALVCRLYGPGTARVASLVVALSPIHIWYSQEARMYSLQILLLLLSTLFMVKAWQEQRMRYYALFAVFSILALFTHMASALFVAGQAMFILITYVRHRRALAAWIGVFMLVGAAFAPWMLAFLADNTTDGVNIAVGYQGRQTSILDPAYAFYTLSVGYSLGPSVAELHVLSPRKAVLMHWPAIVIPGIVFGILAIMGIRRAAKSNPGARMMLLTLLGVPTVLAAIGSQMPGLPLNPRYMLPVVIPYWVLLALGIQACSARRVVSLSAAAAALITGLSLYNHYYEPTYMKQDMRSAAGIVNQQAREGDLVIISSIEMGGPFIYYYKRSDVPFVGYPPDQSMVDPSKLGADIRKLVAGRKRAWLVLGRTWSSDPSGLIRRHFDSLSSPAVRRHYQGVTVLCYDLSLSSSGLPTNR